MESKMTPAAVRHTPVLLESCTRLLSPAFEQALEQQRTPLMIDATLGMGGHSEALLQKFPQLRVIGIDRDEQALALAGERLAPYQERLDLVPAVYDEISAVLSDLGLAPVDGILMDLGVSSFQLDEAERGFAYSYDAPLDMRMDSSQELTAADVVNNYSEADLVRILRQWGEEKFASRIARTIVRRRAEAPWKRSGELVEAIHEAVPGHLSAGHPAKRTFQALRIEVNQELEVLEQAVPQALASVSLGGRCVVMSYHSLEDRIVKKAFVKATESTAPPRFPVELEEHQPEFKFVTKGIHSPSEEEIAQNPRAASARLRAVERTKVRTAA